MPRTVKEWIGKTPDSEPSAACQLRVLRRQGGRCALCTRALGPKNKPHFDHDKPVWADGENRESNLRAICIEPCHADKTAREAGQRAKADRGAKRYFNLKSPSAKRKPRFRRPLPGTKASGWRHKVDGTWERR